MRHAQICLSALLMLAGWGAVAQEARREAGAHVHGSGRLAIAVEGNRVGIELDAPAADILGFEHAPATPAEKAALEQAVAKLKDAGTMFRTPAAAGCKPDKAEAGLEEPPSDKPGEQHEHADFSAAIELVCAAPDKLADITLGYFAAFPAARSLDITIVTAKGQASRTANPGQPVIDLRALD